MTILRNWLWILFLLGSARADVELAKVFARGMAFQRDAAHPVFGSATPGSTVTVDFAGQTRETTADAMGQWRVMLDPMPANEQEQTLTVTSGGSRQVLQEILIGDVWICVGDSLLAQSDGAFDVKSFVDDPLIRQYSGRYVGFHMPLDDFTIASLVKRGVARDLKTQNLTALGFAAQIREASGVPVYMFNVASGRHGHPSMWISPQGHRFLGEENQEMRSGLRAVDPLSETGRAAYMRSHYALDAWLEKSAARVEAGLHPLPLPEFPNEDRNLSQVYNSYLHPLRTLPVKGILWLSMLRDNASPSEREDRLSALFQSWRQAFNRPDLPIYTAQIHDPFPINASRPGGVALGERLAVLSVLKMQNSGLAVSHDLNTVGDFRLPPDGQVELGRRMALWAQHQVYGKNVPFSGPLYRDHRVEGGAMVIEFAYGQGLRAADGGEIHGFYVAGADGGFRQARATVEGQTVRVWSPEIPQPMRLTYATSNAENRANLVNAAMLPAAAFALGDQQ